MKLPPIDFDEVKSAALADIRSLLGRFLPGGKVVRGEYVVLNPTQPCGILGSFRVNLKSGRRPISRPTTASSRRHTDHFLDKLETRAPSAPWRRLA